MAYVQQAIAAVLSCMLTVFSAFVAVNRSSLWYSDWGDLFGFLSNETTATHFGASAGTASSEKDGAGKATQQALGQQNPSGQTPVPAHPSEPANQLTDLQRNPFTNPALTGIRADAPAGQWVDVVVEGQGSAGDAIARIWLPPSYLKEPTKTYPVIMAFAGVPGSPRGFESPLHTETDLAQAVSAGKIRDSIIVAPNVFPLDRDSECMNTQGAAIEDWVLGKVVPWAKTNLRVEPEATAWATYGYSAGGWCANMFTVRHPEVFATSISLSGYYSPVFPDGHATPAGYDLGELVASTRPTVSIWNFSGTGDGKFRRSFDSFSSRVSAPTSLTSIEVEGSSHRWPVWENAQPQALAWLGSTQKAFSPAA